MQQAKDHDNLYHISDEDFLIIHKALITHEESQKCKTDPRRDQFNSSLRATQELNWKIFDLLLNKVPPIPVPSYFDELYDEAKRGE